MLTITGISVANPTQITHSEAFTQPTGSTVTIRGSNSTPNIDGTYTATNISSTKFSIPVNVTGSGNAGFVNQTLFCDYEGGNNGNNGLSFANRVKDLTNGATAARIGPGDIIRMMASPEPTSLGQSATWTDGPLPATFVPTSSTNATPIVFTKTGHGLVTGDTVIVSGHTTNTNGVWNVTVSGDTFTLLNADGSNSVGNGTGGASGTVRKITNSVVKLTTAITQNIACFGNQGSAGKAAWTASANATCSISNGDFKEGVGSQSIAIAAGFTTGLAAYFATGTLDLSGYQQVSFWIKQTAGTLGLANSCSLALCSDAAGTTVVNTVNIPALGDLNRWSPITVDLGGVLGSPIQSIAFIVNTDNGAQTFLLDNIIACKAASAADSLSNTSLIGKNTGTEGWYGIQSINGNRVILDMDTNKISGSNPSRGYSGVSETATLWKRETTKTIMAASGAIVQEIKDSGLDNTLIYFSGGWDRTNMSAQSGGTFFDGQNGLGNGIDFSSKGYLSFSDISLTRYSYGFYSSNSSTNNVKINTHDVSNNTIDGVSFGQCNAMSTVANNANLNGNGGITSSAYVSSIQAIHCNGNNLYGVSAGPKNSVKITDISNNGTYGLMAMDAVCGQIASSRGNNTADIKATSASSDVFLNNSSLNSLVKIVILIPLSNAFLWSTNENNNTDTHFGYTDGGLISSDITTVHTAGGMSWKLSPTSTTRSASYPLPLKVAVGKTEANTPITCKVWFMRDNTGLTARLVCKGGQLSGADSDVIATMTAAANVWEELSVTVTPTQKGVLEFYAEAWGGTAWNAWCDDVSFT